IPTVSSFSSRSCSSSHPAFSPVENDGGTEVPDRGRGVCGIAACRAQRLCPDHPCLLVSARHARGELQPHLRLHGAAFDVPCCRLRHRCLCHAPVDEAVGNIILGRHAFRRRAGDLHFACCWRDLFPLQTEGILFC